MDIVLFLSHSQANKLMIVIFAPSVSLWGHRDGDPDQESPAVIKMLA